VLTLLGSTVWNTLLIGAGYVLGAQWERVSDIIGPLATPILILVALALLVAWLWHRRRRRRARR
jgi:membrane protein DedA with SNARE-associated domain